MNLSSLSCLILVIGFVWYAYTHGGFYNTLDMIMRPLTTPTTASTPGAASTTTRLPGGTQEISINVPTTTESSTTPVTSSPTPATV